MKSSVFLSQLENALEGELSTAQVREQVEYYRDYIKDEVKGGKTEQEVMDELGDPWAIAKTILMSSGMQGTEYSSCSDEVEKRQESRNSQPKIHVLGFDTWWKKAAGILAVVAAIVLIVAIIYGIFAIVLPIVVPILLVVFIVKMLRRK